MTTQNDSKLEITDENRDAILAEYLALKAKVESADSDPTLNLIKLLDSMESGTVTVGSYREFNSGNFGFSVNGRIVIDGRTFLLGANLIDDTKRIKRSSANETPNGANASHADATKPGAVRSSRR